MEQQYSVASQKRVGHTLTLSLKLKHVKTCLEHNRHTNIHVLNILGNTVSTIEY